MARKSTLPPEFNVAEIRNNTRAEWRKNKVKSVTTLERIHRSRPNWLFLIFAAVFLLSGAHTTEAFQAVIGIWIDVPFLGLHIPLGSVGVIAIEFGLLWASFGRFEASKKGVKAET